MLYKWLDLSSILPFVPIMEEQGVSKVARGETPSKQTREGFLEAYQSTKGSPDKMARRLTGRSATETWANRRDQFIKRHHGQVKKKKEKLWKKDGNPTRRHLALIAWAWSPAKEHPRLIRWINRQ